MSEPTTKAEREDTLKRRGKHTSRLLYGPRTMMGRLIGQVEALEKLWKDRMQRLKDDSGDIICDLEDQVKELEAERDRLRDALPHWNRFVLEKAEERNPRGL